MSPILEPIFLFFFLSFPERFCISDFDVMIIHHRFTFIADLGLPIPISAQRFNIEEKLEICVCVHVVLNMWDEMSPDTNFRELSDGESKRMFEGKNLVLSM